MGAGANGKGARGSARVQGVRRMTRRELWRMGGAAIAGSITGSVMAAGLLPGKDFAVKLPSDAEVGSIVSLLKVRSGWIVLPVQVECGKT